MNIALRAEGGGCVSTLCSNTWNQTKKFEVIAKNQIPSRNVNSQNKYPLYSIPVDLKIAQTHQRPVADFKQWARQRLPTNTVKVFGGSTTTRSKRNEESVCEIASPTNSITTFDGLKYNVAFAGEYLFCL